MKLFHWHIGDGGLVADYFCMAEDVHKAREALLGSLSIPGAAEYRAAGHAEALEHSEPTFLVGADYPIVILQ